MIPMWKKILLIVLLAAAVVLAGLLAGGSHAQQPAPAPGEIARAVEQALAAQREGVSGGRTWTVRIPGTTLTRTEKRVSVPREFDSIEFNHTLSKHLAPLGAHVVATERSKEATVTMHIVAGGETVYSVSFVTDPDYHSKEKHH